MMPLTYIFEFELLFRTLLRVYCCSLTLKPLELID